MSPIGPRQGIQPHSPQLRQSQSELCCSTRAHGCQGHWDAAGVLRHEAADEIERLRKGEINAEIERMRASR